MCQNKMERKAEEVSVCTSVLSAPCLIGELGRLLSTNKGPFEPA